MTGVSRSLGRLRGEIRSELLVGSRRGGGVKEQDSPRQRRKVTAMMATVSAELPECRALLRALSHHSTSGREAHLVPPIYREEAQAQAGRAVRDRGRVDVPRGCCQETPAVRGRREVRRGDRHGGLGTQGESRALIREEPPSTSPREHPSALSCGLRCGRGLG